MKIENLKTEAEIRTAFSEAVKGRNSLRGFWHTRVGRELRKVMDTVTFGDFMTVQEKVWALSNDKYTRPKCEICGKPASFYQYAYLPTCGSVNGCGQALMHRRMTPEKRTEVARKRYAGMSEETRARKMAELVQSAHTPEANKKLRASLKRAFALNGDKIHAKRKATCLEKYGVENPQQHPEIKNKVKTTNLERYGTECAMTSPEIHAKTVATNLERYGVENVFASPIIKAQIAATNLERYGATNASQAPVIKEKVKASLRRKYGVENPWESDDVIRQMIKEKRDRFQMHVLPRRIKRLEEHGFSANFSEWNGSSARYSVTHSCGHTFDTHLIGVKIPVCPNCKPKSKLEFDLAEMVEVFGFPVIRNDRKVIRPLELDIVFPDQKVAIEFNGVYWHQKGSRPLIEKTLLAEKRGYTLLHFWDHEFVQNPDLVMHIIADALGHEGQETVLADTVETISRDGMISLVQENSFSKFPISDSCHVLKSNGQIVAGFFDHKGNAIVFTTIGYHVENLKEILEGIPVLIDRRFSREIFQNEQIDSIIKPVTYSKSPSLNEIQIGTIADSNLIFEDVGHLVITY